MILNKLKFIKEWIDGIIKWDDMREGEREWKKRLTNINVDEWEYFMNV